MVTGATTTPHIITEYLTGRSMQSRDNPNAIIQPTMTL